MRVPGYEHSPGRHCGSVSLRNLSDFYGWGFDEPTCFGLASGLGFTFFDIPISPHRGFFGRPLHLERSFVQTLGIGYIEREGEDWETAWNTVTTHIESGRPVMLFLDIYDLDYFGTDTHFAPHAVLAVGYDDERVILSDSEFSEQQSLSIDRLRNAWICEPILPMRNRYLIVTDPVLGVTSKSTTPRETLIETAIREATVAMARYMRDPHDGTERRVGLDGMRALAADMPTWHVLPDPSWTARFAYQNIERRGTGGGAFRGLQRDFFQRVDHPFGTDVTERMAAIADDWTDVGQILKNASEASEDERRTELERAAAEIDALADREEALYDDICSISIK